MTSMRGAEVRRQARADKIKIRTGFNDGIVWALRLRTDQPGGRAEVHRYRDLMRRSVPLAVELGHEPSVMLSDGDEVICACGRCSAVGYGDAAEEIVGGAVFEDECPDEEPPKLTGLAMMHAPGSRWSRRSPDAAEPSETRAHTFRLHAKGSRLSSEGALGRGTCRPLEAAGFVEE